MLQPLSLSNKIGWDTRCDSVLLRHLQAYSYARLITNERPDAIDFICVRRD